MGQELVVVKKSTSDILFQAKSLMLQYERKYSSNKDRIQSKVGWLIAIGDIFTTSNDLPPIRNDLSAAGYKRELDMFKKEIYVYICASAETPEEVDYIVSQIYTWVTNFITTSAEIPHLKRINKTNKI